MKKETGVRARCRLDLHLDFEIGEGIGDHFGPHPEQVGSSPGHAELARIGNGKNTWPFVIRLPAFEPRTVE